VGIVTEAWFVKPIQVFKHPKFKAMIDVAVHATNGVKIPGRKATRVEIMRIFKNHLEKLKETLNVRLFFSYKFYLFISDLERCC